MSDLSFYCEFDVFLNIWLKSKICSRRLQNSIFVQWELAWDEAVKWSDSFCDSKNSDATECLLAREEKSSIKLGLLPQKDKKKTK